MTTLSPHALRPILLAFALALTGCGKSTPQSPPKQQVQDAVRVALPAFLSLDSIELEPISTGPETAKINFKAVVVPKENLYQVEREVAGTPRITLLQVVQAAGTQSTLYGSVEGRRTMDQWTLQSPEIEVGLKQFGQPRGTFGAQSYVVGTNEAAAALKQQAANAAAQEQAAKAALERQERERIAREEQQARERKAREEQQAREDQARKEREEKARIAFEAEKAKQAAQLKKDAEERKAAEEAAKQRVLLATLAGASYSGTARDGDDFVRISLVFSEQKERELLVRAKIFNPDKPGWWRNLDGQLHFEKDAKYPIVLVPADAPGKNGEAKRNKVVGINCNRLEGIYAAQWNGNSLSLSLSDDGMEGEFAIPGGILGVPRPVSVRLTKSKPEGSGTNTRAASRPAVDPVQQAMSLADTYASGGDRAKASEVLERALRENPTSPKAGEAREMLKRLSAP
jgi:multidrug efflux pump subunit AcrA (membrane-fusion protein)